VASRIQTLEREFAEGEEKVSQAELTKDEEPTKEEEPTKDEIPF